METAIIVARAEIELEQEGKDLSWSDGCDLDRVVDLIISKCDKNDWDICRSAVVQLYIEFAESPS